MLGGEVLTAPYPSGGRCSIVLWGSSVIQLYLLIDIICIAFFSIYFLLSIAPTLHPRITSRINSPKFCFCLESKKPQEDIVHILKQENRRIAISYVSSSSSELRLQDYQVNQMTSLSKEREESMAERGDSPESVKENN